MEDYQKNSLMLTSAVTLGTAVMIGAGIFQLLVVFLPCYLAYFY